VQQLLRQACAQHVSCSGWVQLSHEQEPGSPVAVEEREPGLLEEEPQTPSPRWVQLHPGPRPPPGSSRSASIASSGRPSSFGKSSCASRGELVPEGERLLEQNEELHRQLQRLARTSAAAEYERENVIGDPHQTFGVEIEFEGRHADQLD
jgi:hypothetical protein